MTLTATDQYFREVWKVLFPQEEWPATERIALTYMANQICQLRGMLEGMRAPGAPSMQLREKVQWAHDMLTHAIADETLCSLMDERTQYIVMDYVDALCWVLKHDHGPPDEDVFGRTMAAIEMALAIAGHGMIRTGKAKVQ